MPADHPSPDPLAAAERALLEARAALERSARHGALRGDVSLVLTGRGTLDAMLQACCEAVVDRLGTAFARIWLLRPDAPVLELRASAGIFRDLDGPTRHIPVGKLMVGYIAESREAVMSNDAIHEPRLAPMKDCLEEHGLRAFAGYPMIVDGRLVGVLATFGYDPQTTDVLDALASVVGAIGQGVARKQTEEALDALAQRLESEVEARTAELSAANARLEAQARELTTLDRMKDEFISVVSHELRTPLNFIMGFASLIQDAGAGPVTEAQRAYLDRILAGSDRMLGLIDDLLDYAKIRAGKLMLCREAVSLADLLAEVAGNLGPVAAAKGLALEVAPTTLVVPADARRLGQVLQNLVGNAIKFSDAGRIRLVAEAVPGGVRLAVADEGRGIAPEDHPHLFTRFHQLDMGRTREAGGTGLGLAICKELVEAHGGTIGVESAAGAGATFWLTLPSG
jgi:signal transduction histidine kinase